MEKQRQMVVESLLLLQWQILVIAYNLGGLSETVIDGKTGILFNFQTTDLTVESNYSDMLSEINYLVHSSYSSTMDRPTN